MAALNGARGKPTKGRRAVERFDRATRKFALHEAGRRWVDSRQNPMDEPTLVGIGHRDDQFRRVCGNVRPLEVGGEALALAGGVGR